MFSFFIFIFHLAVDFDKLVYRQDAESVMLSRTE